MPVDRSGNVIPAKPFGPRPLRHAVQKDVLNSLTALESVRGFYAIGSTRIKLLDYALLAVLLAGIGGPLGHMTIKWLFRRTRERRLAERRGAAGAEVDTQTLSLMILSAMSRLLTCIV